MSGFKTNLECLEIIQHENGVSGLDPKFAFKFINTVLTSQLNRLNYFFKCGSPWIFHITTCISIMLKMKHSINSVGDSCIIVFHT